MVRTIQPSYMLEHGGEADAPDYELALLEVDPADDADPDDFDDDVLDDEDEADDAEFDDDEEEEGDDDGDDLDDDFALDHLGDDF